MEVSKRLKKQFKPGGSGYTGVQTMFSLLREASEMLDKVPYVKGLAGIINQILEIADVCPHSQTKAHVINSVANCGEQQGCPGFA